MLVYLFFFPKKLSNPRRNATQITSTYTKRKWCFHVENGIIVVIRL